MPKIVDHEARREHIAEAALDAIGRQGLDRVRLSDIARAVGATTGTVTHYFDGKDALLGAALGRLAARLHEQVTAYDGKDFFAAIAGTLPGDARTRRDWRVWLCFWGRAISDRGLAKVHNDHYDRIQAAVAETIEELQESGDINDAISASDLSDAVLAACDGIGVRASLAPREWPAAKQHALLVRMLGPLFAPSASTRNP